MNSYHVSFRLYPTSFRHLSCRGRYTHTIQVYYVFLMFGNLKARSDKQTRIKRKIETISSLEFPFVDMQTSMDDGTRRIETSAGEELSLCEANRNQEPFEGMLFESEDTARAFYDEYARRVGFVTRVLSSRKSERDGSIISRGLGCRGGSDNKNTSSLPVQKQDRRREGCTSMILLKREKPGRWVVRKFVRDHNHPLVVSFPKRRPSYGVPWIVA
ncbi:protein FAR1-RELATED SEQUENCE 2-like [Cornus florida]|uniref:protein FAR1-RELATED SEQUENCE 2-like n=1 Tax=Cornus florida TaxID=4283 RepID=UPI00289644A0|nr:protein FAR1-RELATED SEQUENCE 2-like [Cornus florida]